MEKFKSLKEAQETFEKEGVEYPKYKSGKKEGQIKGSLDALTKIFIDAMAEKKTEEAEETFVENTIENVGTKTELTNAGEISPADVVEETVEESSEEVVETKQENSVPSKPKFHRPIPKRFNPMSFKKY